jgi:ParB/RepB/Spo0J family partition protein
MMEEVSISDIVITGWNPRKSFDEKALEELAASIKEHGILEPLVVRQVNGSYELVAGERRLRAAKLAGLDKVPVVIKELSDQEVKELMLLENLQREDLNPLEEALALKTLLDEGNITQEELGKKLGKSQAWIANRLRLLKAPKELQEMLISREISTKHVLTLLPYIEYPVFTEKILPRMKRHLQIQGALSVKNLESIIIDAIKYDWDGECVLNISSPPYPIRKYKKYMDFDRCEGCKHTCKFEDDGLMAGPYCLNRDCWQKKAEKAKQEYEKELEKLRDSGVVDTSELDWGEYRYFRVARFDQSECENCEHKKKDTDGDPLCLNPECFRKKENAWHKEKRQLEQEEEKKALEALDDYIEKFCQGEEDEKFESVLVPVRALRAIFGFLAEVAFSDDLEKAVKPWKDKECIPDKELDTAILRLMVIHELVELNVESVERIIRKWREEYSSPISIAEEVVE